MNTTNETWRDEAAVRRCLEDWIEALRAKDVDGVMATYAPDVVSFDLAPPLAHRGNGVREGLAAWFPTFDGPVGYETRDVAVVVGDDVAFSRGFGHITGTRTDGQTTDVWVRSTVCLRKLDGAWKIVHEHASVPFYMDGSLRASVDLAP